LRAAAVMSEAYSSASRQASATAAGYLSLGSSGESKLKPVAGSMATVFPERSP
jgi:hypothetical protein